MPRYLPDGSPQPPSGVRESFISSADSMGGSGLQSVGYNQYSTHETMVFDAVKSNGVGEAVKLALGKRGEEKLYSRTAHSEGEMFGLSECDSCCWLLLLLRHHVSTIRHYHIIH